MKVLRKFSKKHYFKRIIVYFLTCSMFFNTSIPIVLAGPEGAQVVNGQVSFQQSGSNTVITASDKSIINYSSFDIARPEIVEFIQPGSSASVLNRILSANPTNINGTLLANGRVFFVNPAGVYIGAGARINVNQLVASALDMKNSDFMNGRLNFAGGDGSVINRGDIVAEKAYLIGKHIANFGNISCPAGFVVMAAGDRVFLGEPGSDIKLEIESSPLPEVVDPIDPGRGVLNEGSIDAAGGTIVLAAEGDIYSQAISNVGSLSVSVEAGDAGEIKLISADGTVVNSGSIEATSDSGKGGIVQMLGDLVGMLDSAEIDASGSDGGGTVLIGGDYQGKGEIPTASRTYVSPDSTIKADAIENGDGGKIIVWADEITGFYGNISARGGAEGGDGGFAEVSGHELVYRGHTDLSAPQGEAGTLLLDPDTITIAGGSGDGDDDEGLSTNLLEDNSVTGKVAEDADPAAFTVYESEIEDTSANIILQAHDKIEVSGNFQNEDLTIQSGFDLTLQTRNDNLIDAEVDIGIDLVTEPLEPGHGAELEIITSDGGSITIETGSPDLLLLLGTDREAHEAPIELCKLTTTGTGNIDIAATGAVTVEGEINSGGNLTINGSSVVLHADLEAAGSLSGDNTAVNVGWLGIISNGSIQDAIDIAKDDAVSADNVTITVEDGTYTEAVMVDRSLTLTVPSGTATMTTLASDLGTTTGLSGLFAADGMAATVFDFGGAVELAGDVDIDSTGAAAGNILFSSTIATGGNNLALDAGPAGNITLSDALTGGGNVTVRDGAVQSYAAMTLNSLDIQDATTSVTFGDDIAATTTIDVISGGTIVQNGKITSGTNLDYDAVGKITTNGKITASGAVDIDSSDNEIEINAAIDPTTVTLQADDDITINADITGATSISAHSGQDGTGDVGFGLGVTLDAPDILLRAGDGPGGAATGAVVDVINNTPEVAADATLTVQQDSQMGTEDDPITVLNEDDPWNPYVGNNGTIDLVMFSDDSSIYTTTADSWKSVAADAYDDITLQGSDAIRDIFTERLHSDNGDISVRSENRDIVANAEIKADAGGVELIAENGRIYTKGGSDDTLNVTISGYSDDAFGTGVGLPGDTDQKAAIKIISKENLNLGSSTELTANGVYYGGTVASDNRDSVVFKSEEPDSGDPIDVAIYLGTKEITSNIEMGSGNVFIENLDVATEKVGTLVIDAGDTITFTGIFEDSLKPGNGSSTVKRIEAVSRITSTLTTPEEQGRFPHGDNPENLADGQFVKNRGVYVLRGTPDGKLFTLAEILAMTDPVPLVPPKPMEPEVRGEVEGPDTEALRRLLEQLGLGEQPELARAYPPSLNTDLDLYKAAERLNGLVPVLQNTNLIAAMDAIIVDVWRNVDSPLAPEQRAVIAQRIGDSPAKGWLVALTDFADILTAMVGRSERETVDAVMATYVIPQMEAGVFHEQTVAFVETQLIPFGG